jgi:hypothetical protein
MATIVFQVDDGAKTEGELKPNAELREAMEDFRLWRNLHGPFATVEEAMCSMLEGNDA